MEIALIIAFGLLLLWWIVGGLIPALLMAGLSIGGIVLVVGSAALIGTVPLDVAATSGNMQILWGMLVAAFIPRLLIMALLSVSKGG